MNTEQEIKLLLRIRELPQVIRDLIGEYNVDHRALTRKLNTEYFGIIFKTCCVCRLYSSSEYYCPTDYFVCAKYGVGHYWCSKDCLDDEPDQSRVQRYLDSIANYLASTTNLIRS